MKTSIITALVIVFILAGETFFRDTFHSIWLVLAGLFVVFLIVYGWIDHKRYPGYKDKKSKES